MSIAEGRVLLAQARRVGKKWAKEYLESERFLDYLSEILRCPDDVADLPETKKRAERIARNIITDLWNDAQRQYTDQEVLRYTGGSVSGAYYYGSPDWFRLKYGYARGELIGAWWDGARAVLFRANVYKRLGDEVKFRADECRRR